MRHLGGHGSVEPQRWLSYNAGRNTTVLGPPLVVGKHDSEPARILYSNIIDIIIYNILIYV